MKCIPRLVLLPVLMTLLGLHSSADTPLPEATNLWTLHFPGSFNTSSSTPAIGDDGTLYLGSFYGYFLAVTPQGLVKWQFNAQAEIHSSPAIGDDGTIYFGSRNRKFYALSPTGQLKWSFSTGGWNDSSPAIATDGTIYFGSWDKNFYALNPNGSLKWKFGEAIVDSSPAIAGDGTIYFGSHDKNFYALNPNGKARWKFTTGGEIISSPAIGKDGIIYFTSTDGNLYAIKPTGQEQWHVRVESMTPASPILDEQGNICTGAKNWAVWVFAPTGQRLWGTGSPVLMDVTPAAVPGEIYVSVPWRTVQAEKAVDQRIWLKGLMENATSSITVNKLGMIYVDAGMYLHAIQPPGELLPPAKSFWPMFRANPRHTGRISF